MLLIINLIFNSDLISGFAYLQPISEMKDWDGVPVGCERLHTALCECHGRLL
ncbi:hypothetical protein SLEP1_g6362 [Rubroshorea leprosula]|uniref:Uncharacterized protein n=1 Tax=Rubroshorea leprosula TaxID=152421 RepID=A0AAV5I4X2_9ROSI|nr:hypothetical protein SLEP1_g6362 [Rubroshorea leprosula]